MSPPRLRGEDLLAIRPSGTSHDGLAPQDMVPMDLDGDVVEGDHAPSSPPVPPRTPTSTARSPELLVTDTDTAIRRFAKVLRSNQAHRRPAGGCAFVLLRVTKPRTSVDPCASRRRAAGSWGRVRAADVPVVVRGHRCPTAVRPSSRRARSGRRRTSADRRGVARSGRFAGRVPDLVLGHPCARQEARAARLVARRAPRPGGRGSVRGPGARCPPDRVYAVGRSSREFSGRRGPRAAVEALGRRPARERRVPSSVGTRTDSKLVSPGTVDSGSGSCQRRSASTNDRNAQPA